MKYYLRVFFWICFPIMVLGLLSGTLNMMNPKAVYIPNGEPGSGFEGIDGVIAAVLSSGVIGSVFGIVGIFIAMIFGYGTKKMIEAKVDPDYEAEPEALDKYKKLQENIGADR